MFCVRGFGGWLGFLLFWGLFWLSAWFFGSRVRGCLFVLFLVVLLRGCAGCGGRVAGGSGSGGRCGAPGSSSCDGWGVGRAGPGFLVFGSRGLGCARFFFRLVGWWGVGRVFFRSALSVLLVPVLVFVVLSGLGFWGVSGWVGVFSPASVVRPGPVWVGVVRFLFGEFDPGSGRTLAACLTHASRTGPLLWGRVEWRTGEYHVSNLPSSPG